MNEPEYPGAAGPVYRPPNPLVKVTRPFVTYTLMAVTVIVFLLQMGTELLLGIDLPAVLAIKSNELIMQGQVWRLLTPMFLHGSLLHIGFNMYALWVMGPPLEMAYGHRRYALLYGLAAFGGNVVSFLFQPSPSLGASTAIFGLIAAQFVLLLRNKSFIYNASRMLNSVIMIALVNFAIGFSGGIDNWGHLGGFLGGMAFAWFAGPLLEYAPSLNFAVDVHNDRDEFTAAGVVFLSFAILALVGIFA